MFFRSRILNSLLLLVLIGGFSLLGYHGFDWWKNAQQRKQLFIYFQTESPVTQRIPQDAIAYVNLYDFKRVHSSLRGTRLYDTIAHWIDTELSGNKDPNPLMGGMLEKTILNVIGEEFALALLPSEKKSVNLFAVSRLAPGSDFILGIALASNRKLKKIQIHDETVYVVPSGNLDLGDAYVVITSGYAYAATDLQRINTALISPSGGPSFLRNLKITQIPEDTFLFARSKQPDFFAILYGANDTYTLRAPFEASIYSSLPKIPGNDAVFQAQTNATEIFGQPSTSLAIHSVDGRPSSRFAFGFSTPAEAKQFRTSFLNGVNYATEPPVDFSNAHCVPLRIEEADWTFCSRGTNLLLAETQLDPALAESGIIEIRPKKLPVTFRIQNNSEALESYLEKIKNGDWSGFNTAREFYFLSCIKHVRGSIDSSNREIVAQIQ